MIIAVGGGKGGTGKTTVAVNLAAAAAESVFLDCDVEAPNAHLFLKPEITAREAIGVSVPRVDEAKCNSCGECGAFCNFGAIVSLKTKPLTFPELCHGCGGCGLVCPEKAISESSREIGVVERGRAGRIEFAGGRLRVGEAMSPPLIRAVKKFARRDCPSIVDAPPGTSCPAVESVRGSDFVAAVAEPTPFGLHDLKLYVVVLRKLGLRFGVVLNRSDLGDDRVREYCGAEEIPILAEFPEDRRSAEAGSRGELLFRALPEYRERYLALFAAVEHAAAPVAAKGGRR